MNVLGYADDFIPRTLVAEAKALAESVGRIPPILARHVVGNDGDGTLAEDIVPGKVAAGDEARPLRGQKAGRQTANRTVGRHLVLRCSAFHGNGNAVPILRLERQCVAEPRGGHTGNGGEPRENGSLHADYLLRLGDERLGDGDPHGLNPFGMGEARGHSAQGHEGADHQAGGDQQHKRERDLRHHKTILHPELPGGLRGGAHVLDLVGSGGPQHGRQSEQHTGGDRAGEHKRERRAIDRDLGEARKISGPLRHEHAHADVGNHQADNAAHDAKRQTFDQQLAYDPSPPRAQRRANGKLLAAGLGAPQHEIGHVGANQQQH